LSSSNSFLTVLPLPYLTKNTFLNLSQNRLEKKKAKKYDRGEDTEYSSDEASPNQELDEELKIEKIMILFYARDSV
jgi:hypothetical protein